MALVSAASPPHFNSCARFIFMSSLYLFAASTSVWHSSHALKSEGTVGLKRNNSPQEVRSTRSPFALCSLSLVVPAISPQPPRRAQLDLDRQ